MAGKRSPGDVESFSRRSATYERSWVQPLFLDRVHRAVLDLVAGESGDNGPESILDVGCGTGRLLRRAAARWPAARLVGVDPAEGMVYEARRMAPGATFLVGFAEALPLPDASVDIALSTFSFHHWNDQAAGVRDAARVLRPEGCFFLADFDLPAGLSQVIRHFRPNSSAIVRELFTQAGLRVHMQQRVLAHLAFITVGVKG